MKAPRFLAVVLAARAVAFPGMRELLQDLSTRQAPDGQVEMIGDLATEGATSQVGEQIRDCLLNVTSCENPSPNVGHPTAQTRPQLTDKPDLSTSWTSSIRRVRRRYLLRMELHCKEAHTMVP